MLNIAQKGLITQLQVTTVPLRSLLFKRSQKYPLPIHDSALRKRAETSLTRLPLTFLMSSIDFFSHGTIILLAVHSDSH